MATNPMLQSVLLFQHHQVNTPYMPHQTTASARAVAEDQKDDQKDDEEEEDEGGEEKKNG